MAFFLFLWPGPGSQNFPFCRCCDSLESARAVAGEPSAGRPPQGVQGVTPTFPLRPPRSPGGWRCLREVAPRGANTRPSVQHARTQPHTRTCARTGSHRTPRGPHRTAASGLSGARVSLGRRGSLSPQLDAARHLPVEGTAGTLQRRMFRGAASCGEPWPVSRWAPARGPRLRGPAVSPGLRGRPRRGSDGLRAAPSATAATSCLEGWGGRRD